MAIWCLAPDGHRPPPSDALRVRDRRTRRRRSFARGRRRSPAVSPATCVGTPSCRPVGRLARTLAACIHRTQLHKFQSLMHPPPTCRPACHRNGQAHFFPDFLTVLPKLLFTIRGTVCDNCTQSMRRSSSRSGGGCPGCSRRSLACGVCGDQLRRLKSGRMPTAALPASTSTTRVRAACSLPRCRCRVLASMPAVHPGIWGITRVALAALRFVPPLPVALGPYAAHFCPTVQTIILALNGLSTSC